MTKVQIKDGDFAAAIGELGEAQRRTGKGASAGVQALATPASGPGASAMPAPAQLAFEVPLTEDVVETMPEGASTRFPPERIFRQVRRTVRRAWWRRALRVLVTIAFIFVLMQLWIIWGIERGEGPDTVFGWLTFAAVVVPIWVGFSSRYVVNETSSVPGYDAYALADVPVFFEHGLATVYRADEDELVANSFMTPDGRMGPRAVKLRERTDLSVLLPAIMVRPKEGLPQKQSSLDAGLSHAERAMLSFGRHLGSALKLHDEKILIETKGLSDDVKSVDVGAATFCWIHIVGGAVPPIDSVCEAIDLAAKTLAEEFEVMPDE
jgi:hypothetical protein